MSFVDTVGPFVLCVLLGLSALIAALAWAAPRVRHSADLVSYHRKAMALVDDLIYEIRNNPNVLPPRVVDEIWGLKDQALAKEINK